jgi:hypothetical protein
MVTLVARNATEAIMAPMVGCGGVWSQTVGFVLVSLEGIWLEKIFSHLH